MKDANFDAQPKRFKACQHHSHAPTFFSDLRVVLVAKTTKFLAIFFFFHLLNNEFIFILEKLS